MSETTPTQTSASAKPQKAQIRRRNSSSFTNPQKVAMSPAGFKKLQDIVKNFYYRKLLLNVPREIETANPDKHFVFINMNELQKNGMWHPNGYRLFKVKADPENINSQKFDSTFDGLIHRNEMVLAYLPKDEYEQRQEEDKMLMDSMNLVDMITKSEALRDFSPHGEETVEEVHY